MPTGPTSPSDNPVGIGLIVKVGLVPVRPFTVTEKYPEEEPYGTITTIAVSLHVWAGRLVPLSETVLLPCEEPKFEPVIVTESAYLAVFGDRPVISGLVGPWDDPPMVKKVEAPL